MRSRLQHGKLARRRAAYSRVRWGIASSVTLCGAFAAVPANAQTAAAAPDAAASAAARPATAAAAATSLESVTVTARKRTERLQDVPLAITAITAKTLEDAGVTNILDIAKLTPGLTINSAGAESGVNITIRGLADLSGGAGDPNVAVFIDGVYQANRSAISLGLLDLERVEVIKGPVSALYGRNAYAGVINYVTKKPLDQFEASVTGGIASSGGRLAKASIGGPIQPGVLAFRLTVGHDESDGTFKDSVNGLRAGGYKKNDGLMTVAITPSKELSIIGSAYYGDDFFNNPPLAYLDNNCGTISKTGVNASVNGGAGAFTTYCGELNVKQHPVEVASINPNAGIAGNNRRVLANTLRATYDFGPVDGTALIGYNRVKQQRFADFTGHRDGIPFITAPNPPGTIYKLKEYFGGDNNNSDKSLELRVASKQNQPLRWAVGTYSFVGNSTSTTLIGADGSSLPPGVTLPAGSTGSLFLTPDGSFSKTNFTLVNGTDRIFSPFGSLEYDLLPSLTGLIEARNTREHKSQDIVRNAFVANTVHPFGPAGTVESDFNFSNYRASARYKLNPDAMLYASVADGTKSGGFNQRATIPSEIAFDPEKNTTIEVGAKSSFFDRKLQLGLAVFHVKTRDMQISGPSDDPKNVGLVTKNFAKATSTGFDFDFAAIPLRGLTLTGGVGYANPKLSQGTYDFSNVANCLVIPTCAPRVITIQTPQGARQVVDLDGLQSPRASKVTFSLGAQYDGRLTDALGWFSRVDYRYESKQFSAPVSFNYWGARNLVNLSTGVIGDKFKVTAYVRNLTNSTTPDAATPNGLINGGVTPWAAYLPTGRVYGLNATYDF